MMRSGVRFWSRTLSAALLTFLALCVTGGAGASPGSTPSAGPLRIDVAIDYFATVDPALVYIYGGWELEHATCATLVNYPDAPPPAGSILQPEIAAAMPTVSPDGLTYTFQIRNDYAFSPPATGVVTAESMKYTFERAAAPVMAGPGGQFLLNIVGAAEYENGQAQHISGIVAQGDTLTFTLIQPQGHFLTYLAMPLFCAVPTTLPFTEAHAPVPSAGPYYISEHAPNQSLVALRNPNYQGPRPSVLRLDRVHDWTYAAGDP